MCLPVRDQNVTVTPDWPAACLAPRSWICAVPAETPLPRLRKGREADLVRACAQRRENGSPGFFALTEPRAADVGGYATEAAPVADKDGRSGRHR